MMAIAGLQATGGWRNVGKGRGGRGPFCDLIFTSEKVTQGKFAGKWRAFQGKRGGGEGNSLAA